MKIDLFYNKEEKSTKFALLEDVLVIFENDGIKETYLVPSGFISDGGSIPRTFWTVCSPLDARYIKAYVKHDWAYLKHIKSRKQIDQELKSDLIASGMSKSLATTIFSAVRLFGESHW